MTGCYNAGITLGHWHGGRVGLVPGEPSAHAGKQRFSWRT